ncbi:hypothetical protein X777_15218, partial [Ooceraea biroi]
CTHLSGRSWSWWIGSFLLLADLVLLSSSLIRGLRILRGTDESAATPFDNMGSRVTTGRWAQPLARILRRRAERPTCRRRQE